MAETPQTNPSNDKAQAGKAADQPAAGKGAQTVAGEPRSFQQNGGDASGDLAHNVAETGRHIAETGRQAGREVAQTWRASLEPFSAMQLEMNRWVDDAFRHMTGFGLFPSLRAVRPFAATGAASLFGLPATDIKETDAAYVLAVELPGLTRDDVEINVDGDQLSVSGHKAEGREDAAAAYRVSERRYGRFERSFPIPPDVERNRIEAAFRDGVLKITLPRDPAAGPKREKIEVPGIGPFSAVIPGGDPWTPDTSGVHG